MPKSVKKLRDNETAAKLARVAGVANQNVYLWIKAGYIPVESAVKLQEAGLIKAKDYVKAEELKLWRKVVQ